MTASVRNDLDPLELYYQGFKPSPKSRQDVFLPDLN